MAGLGNAGLGLVRGRPGAAGAQPLATPTCSSCCFAPPAIVGLLVLAKRPVTRAGWVCLGAGRLADRRLAAHALLEPRARPDGPVRGRERGAHRARRWPIRCSTSRWSAWCSRCTSGARRCNRSAVNTAIARARPDRAVRRPVHLAAAARQLPLRPAARRRLVRRLAAARVRPLGRPRHGRRTTTGTRAWCTSTAGTAQGHQPAAPPGGDHSRYPASRPIAGSLAALTPVSRRRRLHAGHPLQRPRRPQRRPRGAPHRRARSCSPSSCARASCCSTTSPSPRNWPRRRTTSAPWCRAPATSS